MGKKNKKNSEERRQKNLDYIKNLYKNQEAEKEMYSPIVNDGKKLNNESGALALKTNYINKDLRNLIILSFTLLAISIAMYYYDQSTNFLGNLANNLLKDIIK